MIRLELRLPFGVHLHFEVQLRPDPTELVTAVWTEQYREPPYDEPRDCECS